MEAEGGLRWLGMRTDPSGQGWQLPVTPGVTSGANALFGGCATAAAGLAAASLVDQPIFWIGTHFGKLPPAGSEIQVSAQLLTAGRTLSQLAVRGEMDGAEAFSARVAAGRRRASTVEGAWLEPPLVPDPSEAADFDLPVHHGTWAERFEWRLPARLATPGHPSACWWVRPRSDEAVDALIILSVLADYVTYGVGRALGSAMGGLSIDNSLRVHGSEVSEWLLLEVRPDAVSDGLGTGSAYVYDSDRRLLAIGSQTIVVNDWDWRLPAERDQPWPSPAGQISA